MTNSTFAIPEPRCGHCGDKIKRGATEGLAAWTDRQFCSRRCSVRALRRDTPEQREARRREQPDTNGVVSSPVPLIRPTRFADNGKVAAPTEAEWLRVNGGPTLCAPGDATETRILDYAGIGRMLGNKRRDNRPQYA